MASVESRTGGRLVSSAPPRQSEQVADFYESVHDLCLDRLRDALNPATALFDRQLRHGRWAETRGTEDLTSTAICLIGLHRAAVDPRRIGLDATRTLEALAVLARRRAYPGGLGLVVWANAVWDGFPLEVLLDRVGMGASLPEGLASSLTTMETAWLVTGLLHEARRSGHPVARAALAAARQEFGSRHQPGTGLMAHASPGAPWGHRVRRWVANFADQIYSVQALSSLAIVAGDEQALAAANATARRLLALQGSRGQWWWHYDPRSGGVAQGFPVYSVHQYAMAPMALMTLAAATGADFRRPIELSHSWLASNELGLSMLDREAGTVWRDIEVDEGRLGRLSRHARTLIGLGPPGGGTDVQRLRVNRETRPYEWAWCLFAGGIATGARPDAHVV